VKSAEGELVQSLDRAESLGRGGRRVSKGSGFYASAAKSTRLSVFASAIHRGYSLVKSETIWS
jgi:hypothetical protein